MHTDLIQSVPESQWPPELASLKAKKLKDGRRVITNRQLAQLLGCGADNLRKMVRAGRLQRETDLDESTVTWYRLEEAARVYLARRPDRIPEPDYEADIPFLAQRREREAQDFGRGQALREIVPTGGIIPAGVSALAMLPPGAQPLALTPETLTALLVQQAHTQRRMGELLQELVEQRNAGADREDMIADLNDRLSDMNGRIGDMNGKMLARTERVAELTEQNADLKIALARSDDRAAQLAAQVMALTAQLQSTAPAPRIPRRNKAAVRRRT